MTEQQILEAIHMKAVGDAHLAFLAYCLEQDAGARSAMSLSLYEVECRAAAGAQTRHTSLTATWPAPYRDHYSRAFIAAWKTLESEESEGNNPHD